jgi:HAD superfamily hydrolase (TIGR01484 family)
VRYHVLACDYDGTIAHHGKVDADTLAALTAVKETGRRLVLVTGRALDDLSRAFSGLDVFDRIVAENGGVLYTPSRREEKLLADTPDEALVRMLRERGVDPLSVGKAIVATWSPHERTVLDAIHELGLELQVIFNKGAVMVLPTGVNKASGLKAALAEMKLSPHNTVGVGDAENDHAFFALCECSVAVANALPALKARSDLVMTRDHGSGVVELIERLVREDLADAAISRHEIPLGTDASGAVVRIAAYARTVMVAGTSGGGKSTFTTGVLERLAEKGYQMCIVDPEGDYEHFEQAIVLGTSDNSPTVSEALAVLDDPDDNSTVNLLALRVDERPEFVAELFPQLLRMRSAYGRPHWIVTDETHHLFPKDWTLTGTFLPENLHGLLLITVHPDHVALSLLAAVDRLIAIGSDPAGTLTRFCERTGRAAPPLPEGDLGPGEAVLWEVGTGAEPVRFTSLPPHRQLRRHLRKYAEGKLGKDRSFYFCGPDNRLRLRAYNLASFVELGDGLDDDTWLYHLRRGDYSRWMSYSIKDQGLAEEVAEVERSGLAAAESRHRVRQAIERRYTLPA